LLFLPFFSCCNCLFFRIEEILADQESDLDDGKEEAVQKKGRRKETAGTWIAEHSDDIVDLLDPSAAQQVTGKTRTQNK